MITSSFLSVPSAANSDNTSSEMNGWSKAVALFGGPNRAALIDRDSSKSAMDRVEQGVVSGDQIQAPTSTGDKAKETGPAGAFLDDGRRRIDYVLVYQMADAEYRKANSISKTIASDKARRRAFFEANLMKEGLILEKDEWRRKSPDSGGGDAETPSSSTATSTTTVFVKVHGPFATLAKHAERLNVKVPLKLRDAFAAANVVTDATPQGKHLRVAKFCRSVRENSIKQLKSTGSIFRRRAQQVARGAASAPSITVQSDTAQSSSPQTKDDDGDKPPYVTHRFRRRNMNMYASVENQDEFFTSTQRLEIVWEILQKARNDENDEKKRGIELLVETGVYECAFPLHDGDGTETEEEETKDKQTESETKSSDQIQSERQRLRRTWANWKCLAQPQPLHVIRR